MKTSQSEFNVDSHLNDNSTNKMTTSQSTIPGTNGFGSKQDTILED
jgi:hypothetical protein